MIPISTHQTLQEHSMNALYDTIRFFKDQGKSGFMNSFPSVMILYNNEKEKCDFISSNIHSLLGYNEEEIYKLNWVELVYKFMHPDEGAFYMENVYPEWKHFYSEHNVTKEEYSCYRFSSVLRIKKQNNEYSWMQMESSFLSLDAKGQTQLTLVYITDLRSGFSDQRNASWEILYQESCDKKYASIWKCIFKSSDIQPVVKATPREKEILNLLREGKSSAEIAEILYISEHTVKTHRKKLLHKYKAKNTIELVRILYS